MSVDTLVFLKDDRLPTVEEWQRAIDSIGVDIHLENIGRLRTHTGFLPAKFGGLDSGFEWYYGLGDEVFGSHPSAVDDRDHAVSIVTHSNIKELICGLFAAGALAKVADGLFYDEDNNAFVSGDRAIEIARGMQKDEEDRVRQTSEEDARLTDRRCPECGAPCPTYRKTCKACGFAIGRAE